MYLRLILVIVVAGRQVVVDDGIGALAIEADPSVVPQDHRHPLTDVVKVQDAEQLVYFRLAHHLS